MKASAALVQAWQADPQTQVSVIVHTEGFAEQYGETMADLGMTVGRVFRLTNTIAARGLAFQILDLLEQPWVRKIELDQQITTMG